MMAMRNRVRTGCLLFILSALTFFPARSQQGFSTFSTVWITVKYQKGITGAEARRTAEYLQSDFDYLTSTLAVSGQKIEVRMYNSSGKYLEATGQKKPWRFALWDHGAIHMQPVSVLDRNGMFEKSLSFELALAVLEGAAARGCPAWLRTAYAVFHSGIMPDLAAPVGSRVNTFEDLDEELQQSLQPPRRDDILYLLGQTMKFFIERYGDAKALSVFSAFKGTHPAEEELAVHFGESSQAMEAEWSRYIAAHSAPFRTPR